MRDRGAFVTLEPHVEVTMKGSLKNWTIVSSTLCRILAQAGIC